ncbi:hypothetical protein I5192_06295 [Ruegeria sp. SCSIO 43209]|uniref:hypothetical protein n=1 Tax=Ruegeria sp. SCSIO 43209 TaxID=2793010 RepID=UPI00147ADE7D|nr:hypothetical protein [Ruegeria sp. SCSIO 43209]UAB90274.1 hypothetical protein I5192_06295 [Ruegeria sp. SCSIO 43209]
MIEPSEAVSVILIPIKTKQADSVNSKRPKIYCQFLDRPVMEPLSGDRINEMRFYRSLSSFADVYYNDVLIDWERGIIGDPGGLRTPTRDYDLYYVRANPELFKSLPHPKITLAYPYDPEAFRVADALVVTTEAWQNLLYEHSTSAAVRKKLSKWYPDKIVLPDMILNIQQAIDPLFLQPISSKSKFIWHAKMTGSKSFGFFGRVTKETIPIELIDNLSIVRERLGSSTNPLAAFAGSIRTTLPMPALSLGHIPYGEVPGALAACRGTLGQMCADSDYLGSGKLLDAMATKTPIVTRRNAVRDEQLGSAYPGTYDHSEEALDILWRLCTEDTFHSDLQNYLAERTGYFLPTSTGQRISQKLERAGFL